MDIRDPHRPAGLDPVTDDTGVDTASMIEQRFPGLAD